MLILQFVIVETIIFAVVIYFLKKLIFTDTATAVNRLNKTIEESAKQQDEMEKKLQACDKECSERIAKAKDEALKIVQEGIEKAAKERDGILEKAKKQSEEVVQKATDAKEKIRKDLEKEMGIKTVEFSSEILKNVLTEKTNKQFNETMTLDFIDKLQDIDTSEIGSQISEVVVIAAFNLSEAVKSKITEVLAKKLSRKITLKEEVDNKLIAGIMLKFGTLVLDGCLASYLREMSEKLKKEAETK